MFRLNALVFFVLCFSAFYLIRLEHDARLVHQKSYEVIKERRVLEVERQKLVANRSAFVSPYRVERAARADLDMVSINPLSTHFAIGVLNRAKANAGISENASAQTAQQRGGN